MSIHPEMNEGPMGELMRAVGNQETVDVWCKGCNTWCKMNATYAAIIKTGEIESCAKCRK